MLKSMHIAYIYKYNIYKYINIYYHIYIYIYIYIYIIYDLNDTFKGFQTGMNLEKLIQDSEPTI